jgi:hypothetical protein
MDIIFYVKSTEHRSTIPLGHVAFCVFLCVISVLFLLMKVETGERVQLEGERIVDE